MGAFTIGEVAARSGFTTSALRYYEGIGLLVPVGRTDAGYRVYDDRALDRLAFIARAKELGCTLEEITDLVSIWDGDRCGPVQRRFHDLVTEKIDDARRRIGELAAFTEALRQAATQLSGAATDGPCDERCACLHEPGTDGPATVPIACTLEPAQLPDRLGAWEDVLTHARHRTDDGGLRVELGDDVPLAGLTALVAAEQRCCAFFSFSITVDGRGIGLEVRAPDGAQDVVSALFGQPSSRARSFLER